MASEPSLAGFKQSTANSRGAEFTCAACGAGWPQDQRGQVGIRLQAVLPQPISAALLLARKLTSREWVVFQLLGFGYDNHSIAREMNVSERTVKRFVTAILAKLELESRLQAGLTALIISSFTAADACWPEGRMDFPREGS
jgi:DNA-binding CsgD family transcriptional regulator